MGHLDEDIAACFCNVVGFEDMAQEIVNNLLESKSFFTAMAKFFKRKTEKTFEAF